MRKTVSMVMCSILLGNFTAFSQTKTSQDSVIEVNKTEESHNPLFRLGRDIFIQAVSPFKIDKDNVYFIGAGLLTTAGLIATDQGSYNTIKKAQQDLRWIPNVSHIITEFGSKYGLGFLGLFAGYSFITNNSKAKETSYLATESCITSGIWTVAIKWLTGRERPTAKNTFSNQPGGDWDGPFAFLRKEKGQSISSFDAFPSGHTATAFSIATVFAVQYDDNLLVPVLSYGMATLVGVSRIIEDTHWVSDVFVGALLGYLTSMEILKNNPSELSRDRESISKNIKNSKNKNHLLLGFNGYRKSIRISYKF